MLEPLSYRNECSGRCGRGAHATRDCLHIACGAKAGDLAASIFAWLRPLFSLLLLLPSSFLYLAAATP